MNHEVTTANLCRLLGVSRETLSKLAKRGIVSRGDTAQRDLRYLQPPLQVSLAAWRCCSSDAALGYERLIVALHHGVMALTPEQHSQIAAVYDKAAADYMVPAPQRAAFARKAEMFRLLARLGAKPKSAPPQRASAPANESADTLSNPGMISAARHLFAWQQRR
jgi:hypothetical protein